MLELERVPAGYCSACWSEIEGTGIVLTIVPDYEGSDPGDEQEVELMVCFDCVRGLRDQLEE